MVIEIIATRINANFGANVVMISGTTRTGIHHCRGKPERPDNTAACEQVSPNQKSTV